MHKDQLLTQHHTSEKEQKCSQILKSLPPVHILNDTHRITCESLDPHVESPESSEGMIPELAPSHLSHCRTQDVIVPGQ